jgi:putative molybdopterin biosynthesis protein
MADSPFLRDVPAARALEAWRSAREAAGCPSRVPGTLVRVDEAAGLVTAGPVWAARSSPPFDAAAMDGIAVRAADTEGASDTTPVYLAPDAYDVVDTGDPVPPGRDAVVMREHVHYSSDPASSDPASSDPASTDPASGSTAELRAAVPRYQHVRSIGEDVSAGELLLPGGHRLRAADLAVTAAAGITDILVRRRPVVAILPTGDEVRPIGAQTGAGEITDTNSLMLATQVREAGCEARCLPVEPDDPTAIAAAVRAAVAGCDLLIIVAGSSAGRDDYTARVVAELGTLAVHGVTVRPGHPVVLGVVGRTPVLGAPGYPVSAALTFDIFAEPLLAELRGVAPRHRQRTRARLGRKVASPLGTDDWVRVRLAMVGGRMVATPLPRGAGVLTSLVRADGLLVVPAGLDGHHPGDEVEIELLRGLDEISGTIVAMGSHDLALDLVASALRADDPLVTLATSNVGSLDGLAALRDGLCHISGSHLLDPETGEYTLPYLDRILGSGGGSGISVVRLVHRDQGLMVAPGNPAGLTGLQDLTRAGVRYVNRQRGSGTRVLLDCELSLRSIDPESISGYVREELTHLAVAAAIAAGRADTGLGIMAAARAFGLDFVPVTREPYDLVVAADTMESPLLAPLWALLRSDRFQAAVEELGGYSAKEMGRRLR